MTRVILRCSFAVGVVACSVLPSQQPASNGGGEVRAVQPKVTVDDARQRLAREIVAARDAAKEPGLRARLELELAAWQQHGRLPVSLPAAIRDYLASVQQIRERRVEDLQRQRIAVKDAGRLAAIDQELAGLRAELATKDLLWKLGAKLGSSKGRFAFEGSTLVKQEANGDPDLLALGDAALPRHYRLRITVTRTGDQPGQRLVFPFPDPKGVGVVFGAVALGSGVHGEGSAFVWQDGKKATGQRNGAEGRLAKGQATTFVFEQDGVAMRLYDGDTLLAELPIESRFELPKEWAGQLATGAGAYLQVAAVSGLRIDRLECQELTDEAVKVAEAAAKKAAEGMGLLAIGDAWSAVWNDPRHFRTGQVRSCVVESSSPTSAVLKIVCYNKAAFRLTLHLNGGNVTDVDVVHLKTSKGKPGSKVISSSGAGLVTKGGGKITFQWEVDSGQESCELTIRPKK